MIEVYYAPPSIYGRKVLIVLMEKIWIFVLNR
jgi:glutathione S-transferase